MTEEPILILPPRREWDNKAPERPRPRCGICGGPTTVSTIDRGRVKKEKKVGRPKKDERRTRYTKIGQWCVPCELFYYPNRSPNWKMRLKSLIKKKRRKRT